MSPRDEPPASRRDVSGLLTHRERGVLQRVALGDSLAEAARNLGISVRAAMSARDRILARMGARNLPHAVHLAHYQQLLSMHGCGHPTTHHWHRRRGEDPDPACRKAWNRYSADQRKLARQRT